MEDQKNPASRRPPKSGVHVGVHSRNANQTGMHNQTVVIPDTPDKVCKQHRHIIRGPRSTHATSSSRNLEIVGPRALDKPVQCLGDSRQNSGVHCNNPSDKSSGFGHNKIADSSVVSSSVFKNAPGSRMDEGKIFKDDGIRHKEVGRASHSRLSAVPHHHRRTGGPVLFEHGEFANSSRTVAKKESGVKPAENWVKHSRDDCKGKAKIDHDVPISSDARNVQGRDVENNVGRTVSRPLQSTIPPKTNRRIVLVRNGCISPHNTAKAKQLAESSVNDHAAAKNAAPNGLHHVIDVDEVNSKETTAARAKGKGVVILTENHKDRRGDAVCLADERGKRKIQGTECRLGQVNTSSSNNTLLGKCSSSEPVVVLNEGQFCTPSTSRKRQKKHGSEAEVICLSSCGESSRSKSMMNRGSPSHRAIDSPIVIGELSPEVREDESQSEARALQVQADEMLARELQEQMYNEIPEAPADEGVLQLIREQQQEEANNMQRASRVAPRVDAAIARPAYQPRRQSQSTSLRSRLLRRGAQARSPTSRLRSHIYRYPRGRLGLRNTLSPSEIEFPSDMDMDMRVGLLEAMEAVAHEDIRMVTQLLDSDREFNENDYEMLLALDENNHRHLGASVTQIRNLPESIVQNDSSEACSICLENPTVGDTIRHLPCLHKFHKDCIDPWLRRKRSCPVCKSDV